jgi:hypothetical protein
MATSIYRGPVTFEDGSTANDVESFDDGTWINHELERKRAAALIKESSDKAERKIKVPSYQPCTVLQVAIADGISGGVATVHVDGDGPTEMREVTISSTYTPHPGDRAQLVYTPPHGASIVAPIGPAGGDPCGAVNSMCADTTGIGVPDNSISEPVLFCCEEFTTGGVTTDEGTLLRVPTAGIYSVWFECQISSTAGTSLLIELVVANDGGDRIISTGYLELNGVGTLHAGRAATPMLPNSVITPYVTNISGETIVLERARLDCAWQTAHPGIHNDCESDGGEG